MAQTSQVAALLWGSVKIGLLVALNFSEFFEKISKRFAQLSAYFPRLSDYERIFGASPRVQNALADFYAAVVQFCCQVVQTTQESGIKRFGKSFWKTYKTEYLLIEENISAAKEEVDEEIKLASENTISQMHRLQLLEHQENQRFRSQQIMLSQKTTESLVSQEWALKSSNGLQVQKLVKAEERHRIRLIDLVFNYNYMLSVLEAQRVRYDGTCTWISENPSYKAWMENPACSLWCHGVDGYGKTILAGYMVSHLSTPIYYFFDFKRKQSLEFQTFLRSILHQLLDPETLTPRLQRRLELIFGLDGRRDPDELELQTLIMSFLPCHEVFMVIDGIEELEESKRPSVFKFLKIMIQNHPKIKLFITSTPDIDINSILGPCHEIDLGANNLLHDIELFVNRRVDELGNLFSRHSPNLLQEMRRTLCEKANGMFLWVNLQIDDLKVGCHDGKSEEELVQQLQNLPKGLAESYSRTTRRLLSEDTLRVEVTKKLFQWVSYARRPLSIDELEDAISIKIGQTSWKKPLVQLSPAEVSRRCGNFVVYDQANHLVTFAHHTVLSFLRSFELGIDLQPAEAEKALGKACITYLGFSDFERALVKSTNTRELLPLAQPLSILHGLSPGRTFHPLISRISRREEPTKFSPTSILMRQFHGLRQGDLKSQFPLLKYCEKNWYCHPIVRSGDTFEVFQILRKLLFSSNLPFRWTPWDVSEQELDPYPLWSLFKWAIQQPHEILLDLWRESVPETEAQKSWDMLWKRDGEQILASAAASGHVGHVKLLLAMHKRLATRVSVQVHICSAIVVATHHNQLSVLKLLLSRVMKINNPYIQDALSQALHVASERGNLPIVDCLLKNGANVNHFRGTRNEDSSSVLVLSDWTALQVAAGNGHLEVVHRLVAAGADVNAWHSTYNGRTALQAAATGNHLDVVCFLIHSGANINALPAKHHGRTALQAAAECGSLPLVEILLQADAHVNAAPSTAHGRTALQAAAGRGHLNVVQRLLQANGDVNASPCTSYGLTALQAATSSGNLAMVQYLLKANADANALPAEHFGQTALGAAALAGHTAVIDVLLQANADVHAKVLSTEGCTALQAAARGGNLVVVEQLIQANADVNAPAGKAGMTAIQAAARHGHLTIVERLLQANADVEAPPAPPYGRNALQAAAEGGFLSVVERLIQANADVNASASQKGLTALQAAARAGHLAVVDRLLEANADVNSEPAYYGGQTALQAAAAEGHLPVVERLLQANANVNLLPMPRRSKGALQAAAKGGHLAVVQRLLKAHADVNACCIYKGYTALHEAARKGHLQIVECLLHVNADVSILSAEGLPALSYAEDRGHKAIAELLRVPTLRNIAIINAVVAPSKASIPPFSINYLEAGLIPTYV